MDTKGNILVIDDEDGIRKGCRRVLEPAGFKVETASSFQEGLGCIAGGQYDLVLLDVMMPDGRGVDLLGPIWERDPETVAVIITGYATVELAVESIKRGAYDFISKPFTADLLLMTVNRGMEKRRLVGESRRLREVEEQAAELTRAKEQAERLNEFKSFFATMVAHELRSPVSGIQSLVRTMLRGLAGDLSEQQSELLSRINVRLDFLQALINDLLTLAASKSLEHERPLEAVPLQAVIERVVERFAEEARAKGISLKPALHVKALAVRATDDGLDTVLRNLVGNAIKYTPNKGQVRIEAAREEDLAVVRVADSGIGIAAEDLAHIGEEFFRARNAHEKGIPGTGLGMSIVHQYVERFGGRVDVVSQEGQGTTFTLTLPVWQG
ncbi:MAG: response regulator [Anaerolineales bacterium]|nr:response regulator [Anaerolineales bacterium]